MKRSIGLTIMMLVIAHVKADDVEGGSVGSVNGGLPNVSTT